MTDVHNLVQTAFAEASRKLGLSLPDPCRRQSSGKIRRVSEPLIEAELRDVRLGELCSVFEPSEGHKGTAEIVGIQTGTALVLPHAGTSGLSSRAEIMPLRRPVAVACSSDMLGCVLDSLGRTVKRIGPRQEQQFMSKRLIPLYGQAAEERLVIREVLSTGIRVIDSLLTVGVGQRLCIAGPPGSGKTSLVWSILSNCKADVIVCGLIGERGREITDFLETMQKSKNNGRLIVVASTSDRPALERLSGANTATAIAEYFRLHGLSVVLILDSMTRVARAMRDVGLARGEPLARRGYTASVYTLLPQLFERVGRARSGSITAFYTVLSDADGSDDPIVEECKSLLDGHIMLSRDLASAGRFPAVDVLSSISRTMTAVVSRPHMQAASFVRANLAILAEIEMLRRIGEYKPGADAQTDAAVRLEQKIMEFRFQSNDEFAHFDQTVHALQSIETHGQIY